MPRGPKLKLPAATLSGEASYLVGYGKPPPETRFQPGRSGNPRGRPKGARNKLPALNEERLKDIIIAEAYRSIKVNDGNRQITVPMAQAVMRSLAVNAVKGQHRSQRLFAELLSATERANKALHDEWRETAFDYKKSWTQAIAHCRKHGLPEPDPVPHPEDIELDMSTGLVIIRGPFTEKQRQAGLKLIALLKDSQEELANLKSERGQSKSAKYRDVIDQQITSETRAHNMLKGFVERLNWRMFDEETSASASMARSLATPI